MGHHHAVGNDAVDELIECKRLAHRLVGEDPGAEIRRVQDAQVLDLGFCPFDEDFVVLVIGSLVLRAELEQGAVGERAVDA